MDEDEGKKIKHEMKKKRKNKKKNNNKIKRKNKRKRREKNLKSIVGASQKGWAGAVGCLDTAVSSFLFFEKWPFARVLVL